MKRVGVRKQLRAGLDRLERRTRDQSPFQEENLLAVQKICSLYCKGHRGKYITDIDWRRRIASVTVETKACDPMRDWEFLRSVEPYVLYMEREVMVSGYEATFRVRFLVKFF